MPPKEKKGLATLPPELLLKVASFLPVSALAALSKTCKALHFQLEPSLHKSIDWKFPLGDHAKASSEYLLLRTLLRRPLLAPYIKSVSIYAHNERKFSRNSFPCELEVIRKLCEPFPETFERLALSGDPGVMTVLLLFRLRHLNVLVLHPEISISVSRLVDRYLSETGRYLITHPYFHQLKEVYLPSPFEVGWIANDIKELVRILPNLPSLEVLDIFLGHTIGEPLELLSQVPLQLPRLSTLGIINGSCEMKTVASLFSAAPNLVTLEYHLSQDMVGNSFKNLPWGEWANLVASLKVVSKTFKSLTISTGGWDRRDSESNWRASESQYSAWERQGQLSSSNSLDVLERLDVPIFALLGCRPNFSAKKLQDILPSSLRELCIRDDINYGKAFNWVPRLPLDKFWHSHDILEQLRDYLPNRSHNIEGKYPAPSLRKLPLRMRPATSWSHDDLATLRDICRGAGVMCTVLERLEGEDHGTGRCCVPRDEPVSIWTEKRCCYVKEVTLYDPSDSTPTPKDSGKGLEYKSRVFHQPGRVVPYRG
ncbi:hypothetical protein FQN50_008105 [Emmonsiellopsis sp. PD_5]|nr:hypothetical protein FQN50_008105 [Emmonsiellopsis sp. PD_5]